MKCFNLTDIDNSVKNDLFNFFIRVDNIYIASKITTQSQLDFIKLLDIKVAIDLKLEDEVEFEDRASFKSKGINYIHFPIDDIKNITFERLKEFSNYLRKDDSPILIYCFSGNRVGALLALQACFLCGHPKQRSYDFGLKAGMTKETMQQKVRNIIYNKSI